LEHRASNPVSIKNLNTTETSVVEALVPARTKRISSSSSTWLWHILKGHPSIFLEELRKIKNLSQEIQ
jgi:hypothetical protein